MAKANAGSFNADTNLDLHINVDDGQLVELVKTLKTLSQGNDLKQYWKNVDAAIQSAQRSALQYKKNINSTFNAKDFVKNYNALKAITQKDTISDLFPDIDNIDTLFESAKKLVPDIASQFSSKTFSQVFQTLESLESKGLELDDVFKKLQRYNSLEKEVRGLRQENFEFRDLIGDEDIEKLKSYKNEVMKLREEYKVTFKNFLLSHNISPTDDYGYLNFEDYFQSIEKGTLTASEAIQKFKNNEKALLESKFELNDDTFNVDYFQEFSNKLEQIFSRVEDIYRNLDEVITNGIITKNGDGSSFPLFDDILENEEKFQSLITLIQKVKEELNIANKSDISSDKQILKNQNEIREELIKTKKQADETSDAILKVTGYRGTNGGDPVTINKSGATFWDSNKKIANLYGTNSNDKTLWSSELSFKNPLIIDAKNQKYGDITYLGDGIDKTSQSIIELTKRENELRTSLQNSTESGLLQVEMAYELQRVCKEISDISNSIFNPYGTHSTDWFAEYAKQNGYDGVYLKNVLDTPDSYAKNDAEVSDVFITFQREQLENTILLAKANKELSDSEREVALSELGVINNSNSLTKNTFQDDAEKQNLEEIRSATEAAAQAKKEFASANGEVKASANGSKSPLQLESELMQQIAKSAREAANAKKEFVDANKEVSSSVEKTKSASEKNKPNSNKKGSKSKNAIQVDKQDVLDMFKDYFDDSHILSQINEATDDAYAATYRMNKGQILSVKYKAQRDEDGNYLYDDNGDKLYSEDYIVISNYEQLKDAIINADNALRKLKDDKDKILEYDKNASTTNIDKQIESQKQYIQLLEDTVTAIANIQRTVVKEDGTQVDKDAFLIDEEYIKKARKEAEDNYLTQKGIKNEMSSAKQSAAQSAADEKKRIADEKKRLANIEQVNRSLNKQQIHIDSIEKSYNKSINKDLDRAVTNQNDLTELNNKKTEIQNLINKLKDTPRDNGNENEFLQLERLINEYKELSKYKLKANNPSKQELGGQKLEVLVQQQISAYDKLILKAQSYGEEAKDVLKILQDQREILAKQDDNGKFIATADEYYTARDNLKVESAIFSVFEAEEKSLNKAWEEAKKVNDALNETQNILSKLPEESKKGLESTQYNELENKIIKLNEELKSGKKIVSDYKKEVASLTSDYSKNFNEKENKVYDELTNTLSEYEKVKKRIANNQALDGDVQAAADLSDKIQQLQTSPILSQEHLDSSEKQLEQIKKDIELIEKKRAKQDSDKKNAALKETEKSLAELPRTKEFDTQFSDLEKKVASLNEELKNGKKIIADYKSEIKSLTSNYSKSFNEKEAETFKDLTNTLKEYKEVKTRISKGQALDGDVKLASQLEDKILNIQNNPILSQKHLNESMSMLDNIYRELDVIDQKTEKMRNKAISKANDSKKEQLDRLKKAVTDYSDGDTTEANAKIKELEDNLARNFSRLIPTDSINKVIAQLKKEVDSIIGNLKKSSSENQKAEEAKKKSEAKAIETEWKDAVNALKKYEEAQTELNNLKARNKDGSNKDSIAGQEQYIKSLQASYESARQTIASFFTSVDKYRALLNFASQSDIDDTIERLGTAAEGSAKSVNHLSDEMRKASQTRLDGVENTLKSFQSTADKLAIRPDGQHSFESWTHQLTTLNTLVKEFDDKVDVLRQKDFVSEDDVNDLKALEDKIKSTIATMNKVPQAQRGFSDISVAKAIEKINKILQDNTRYSQAAKDGLKALIKELETSPNMPVEKYLESAFKIQRNERAMGREGKSLGSILKDKVLYGFAGQLAGMFGIYDVINIGKQGIASVRELDTALTEMRKVSDETVQSLKNYQATTFDVADTVGTTALQIQESTANWMRLGESMETAAESAKAANILLNVSEFENIDSATESLVAMSQAYSELSKMDIIDVLNNIGNNYSISTDGLATALQKSASALKTANNDLNSAVALATAGNAIVQDPDSVGAGIRTISLRLVGTEEAKEELASLGEETDDVITTASKLRNTILSATKAATKDGKGFDIFDANGNYKSTYEIMQGLADLYDEIVAKDKELGTNNLNLLLETIAGKNRSNIAASILQNGDMLRSVYENAQNSAGSAEKELNAYLESIDGKMAQLENRVQEFWATAINSDFIKGGIDLINGLLKGVTSLVDQFGLLAPLFTIGGGILGAQNLG